MQEASTILCCISNTVEDSIAVARVNGLHDFLGSAMEVLTRCGRSDKFCDPSVRDQSALTEKFEPSLRTGNEFFLMYQDLHLSHSNNYTAFVNCVEDFYNRLSADEWDLYYQNLACGLGVGISASALLFICSYKPTRSGCVNALSSILKFLSNNVNRCHTKGRRQGEQDALLPDQNNGGSLPTLGS
jgi:hypothetical protein